MQTQTRHSWFWIMLALAGVWLAACGEAAPTPVVVTEMVVVATETTTLMPPTPTTTTTKIPSVTSRATPSPTPFPSPTPLAPLVWAINTISVKLDADPVFWSPTANELVFNNCSTFLGETLNVHLFRSAAPEFWIEDITPTSNVAQDVCQNSFGLQWAPDGNSIIFAGGHHDKELHSLRILHGDLWRMDRTGTNARALNQEKASWLWMPRIIGWLNEENFIFSHYSGGGTRKTSMLNVHTGELTSLGSIWGSYGSLSKDYISLYLNASLNTQDGNVYPYTIAAVVQRPDADLKPENAIAHTWRDQSFLLSVDFGSGFIDWLPKTNKMLVLTWGTEAYPHENKESYLQLWDVDTGELTILAPNGAYGRFSPDGNYLAYYTRSPESQIRVVNINSRKLLLSLPSVTLDLSVSIFTPSSIFYEALLWSPDNTQLIYRDEKENLALLNVTNGRSTPLTLSGGARLSNPKWSFDGRYLSVRVQNEAGWKTAVLQVP